MNQILFSKFSQEIKNEDNNNTKNTQEKSRKKLVVVFRFQLVISIFVILCCFAYYMYNLYSTKQKESISKQLLSNFNINLLYSDSAGYTTSISEVEESNNSSFIIGLIEIKKLKIVYPILSGVSDELLEIATCRFYGPMPNEVGNLCIAAHNYNDYRFFSRIKLLETGDSINIYDADGNVQEYHVTDKYTISSSDSSCISQDTNGEKQITLLTCNNVTGYRLVVKATAVV